MNKIYSILILIFLSSNVFANGVEMADTLRNNGKIYVVVATLVIIFVGIVIYMISIDRRIHKLEKERK